MKIQNSTFPALCFTTRVNRSYENWLKDFMIEPNDNEIEKMQNDLINSIPYTPINNPHYGNKEGA